MELRFFVCSSWAVFKGFLRIYVKTYTQVLLEQHILIIIKYSSGYEGEESLFGGNSSGVEGIYTQLQFY